MPMINLPAMMERALEVIGHVMQWTIAPMVKMKRDVQVRYIELKAYRNDVDQLAAYQSLYILFISYKYNYILGTSDCTNEDERDCSYVGLMWEYCNKENKAREMADKCSKSCKLCGGS